MKSDLKITRPKGIPRFDDALTFKDLIQIIELRMQYYPTDYMDFLLLNKTGHPLSMILNIFKEKYPLDKHFKYFSALKAHVKWRQGNNRWIFKITGDHKDPIVMLTGFEHKI